MYKFFVLAVSAALASAYTTPTTQCIDGCNPTAKPGLNEIVPVGVEYTVTWQPTTDGTLTLVLLKGPSDNVVPLYAVAEKIVNTGTFAWTPALDLEPTGNSGYGFQLINDADGTYQWSVQFGISNPDFTPSASGSASPSSSATAISNGTISSEAASAVPTGFSNFTASISSPASEATDASTTLTRATNAGAATASSSSSTLPSNAAAAALGAVSMGGAIAAIMVALGGL